MKIMRKRRIVLYACLAIFGFIVAIYEYSPLTPEGAIRFNLFYSGYPIEAVSTKIETYVDTDGKQLYWLSNPPLVELTGTTLARFHVVKKGFYYYSTNAGHG